MTRAEERNERISTNMCPLFRNYYEIIDRYLPYPLSVALDVLPGLQNRLMPGHQVAIAN